MELQRLSEHFKILKKDFNKTGAFDAVIGVDSSFYIDPTLLMHTKMRHFQSSYKKILEHFRRIYLLILAANTDHQSKSWKAAIKLAKFKEIPGIALGYGKGTTSGNAISSTLAEQLLLSAEEVTSKGIKEPELFLALGVLEEGIGADRISDMTVAIIIEDLLAYTQDIAKDFGIKAIVKKHHNGIDYYLPQDPLSPGKSLIFVPKKFLRTLPTFEEGVFDAVDENEILRRKVNSMIGKDWKKTSKNKLKQIIFADKDSISEFISSYVNEAKDSYDFERDADFKVNWLDEGRKFVEVHPLKINKTHTLNDASIKAVVINIIGYFKHAIENLGLDRILYAKDGKVHNEDTLQKLFLAISYQHCKNNDLDIAPETALGGGAIDFKISHGFSSKFLVELKWDKNPKLVQGYEKQMGRYAECEETPNCFYVVVEVTKDGKNIGKLTAKRSQMLSEKQLCPELFIIDGKIKPTASRI